MSTTRATVASASVTFSADAAGNIVVDVASDDPLARDTLTVALREFWRTDEHKHQGANEAKWRRRLRA